MKLEDIPGFRPELLRCPAGHDHATEPVWASVQQQGVYSKKRLANFHCGSCGTRTASTARPENWTAYPISLAVELGHVLPCNRSLPNLAALWRQFLEAARQNPS